MDRSEDNQNFKHHLTIKAEQIRAEYALNPKHCIVCGNQLSFENRKGKFCGHSCSASHNNRGVARNVTVNTSHVCSCGKPKKTSNKYCAECARNQVYRPQVTVETVKCEKIRRQMLIDERGYKCEKCGVSEWFGHPVPLEMHHISGNTDDNSRGNLILLCANCHGIMPHHRSQNKKNGRRQIMRRKRYADGQTW
jgi:hypothetical protein